MSGDNKKETGRRGEEIICATKPEWRIPSSREKAAICRRLGVKTTAFDVVRDTPFAIGEAKTNTNIDGWQKAKHDLTRNEIHAAVTVGKGQYFLFHVDCFSQTVKEAPLDYIELKEALTHLDAAASHLQRALVGAKPRGIYPKFGLFY